MTLALLDQPSTALTPSEPVRFALAEGDGIGPEIMAAVLDVLDAAGLAFEPHPIAFGERLYRAGHSSGIDPAAWGTIAATGQLLKAPITTPLGGGVKSLNVTLRKTLGLYANVRPCIAYAPFVPTKFPGMDVLIVRENEEDLYAGIEHRQTDDVYQCLKLVSRSGCERIVRYAFELARAQRRSKLTCVTKNNIMKLTDGIFVDVFRQIGAEYGEIEQDHMLVDIAAARLAADPARFDVIVTPNLYGDILSDIAAEVAGSVGLAPSANIGPRVAMFEAIHGSAPDIAGQDIANPSGLLLAACMMLDHAGRGETAVLIRNAWARTIEDGMATRDIGGSCGTQSFAKAVAARLGESPRRLPLAKSVPPLQIAHSAAHIAAPPADRRCVGIDIFVQDRAVEPDMLAAALREVPAGAFELTMITNRGVKVWPNPNSDTLTTDHWRCRFMARDAVVIARTNAIELALVLSRAGIDVVKTEGLYTFDGVPGYSVGQGQ
ncbi:MAG: NADP-dependent isocitrate dehydrogenase [Sphingomonas bacterium]|nr:NADP-dependent isocitrate dehydrogenase [Sphingomonas bacterium]